MTCDNNLKHSVSSVQFKYDAANTPYIAGIRPAQLCNTAKQPTFKQIFLL